MYKSTCQIVASRCKFLIYRLDLNTKLTTASMTAKPATVLIPQYCVHFTSALMCVLNYSFMFISYTLNVKIL